MPPLPKESTPAETAGFSAPDAFLRALGAPHIDEPVLLLLQRDSLGSSKPLGTSQLSYNSAALNRNLRAPPSLVEAPRLLKAPSCCPGSPAHPLQTPNSHGVPSLARTNHHHLPGPPTSTLPQLSLHLEAQPQPRRLNRHEPQLLRGPLCRPPPEGLLCLLS